MVRKEQRKKEERKKEEGGKKAEEEEKRERKGRRSKDVEDGQDLFNAGFSLVEVIHFELSK